MQMRLNAGPIIKGALTYVPGLARLMPENCGTSASADYCYGVWLKHLAMLHAHGAAGLPGTLVELGPGTSLGTGIAALLSGVERYVALDAVPFCDPATNLRVFDELVELFLKRAGRPAKGWPDFDRHLDDRLFPGRILTDSLLRETLSPGRIRRLRKAVAEARPSAEGHGGPVSYLVPWEDESVLPAGSADLVVTHTVLSHVNDVHACYRAMKRWLRPGGWMSHQIDFAYPGYDGRWNGYWACSDAVWKIIRGRRPFGINRLPCSSHATAVASLGFETVCRMTLTATSGWPRSQLAAPWNGLSDEDLQCSSLFLIARKPSTPHAEGPAAPAASRRADEAYEDMRVSWQPS
ncbi:MAG TPA: class I SAM-dependent methyltransferase [Rhodocyclaceae bacterium]